MALNLEACRTCLKTSKKNFNLYSDIGDDKLISEVLMEEIPIKLHKDDGLPVKICDTCLKKLKQIRDFKTMVIESDTKLHELNKNVEKETLEDNSATDIDSIKVEICEEEVDPLSHTNDTEMPTFVEVPVEKIIENSASVSGVKNCLPAKEKEEWSHVDEFEIKDEFMKEAEESGEVEKIEIISENVGNEELSNSEMEDNDLASLEDQNDDNTEQSSEENNLLDHAYIIEQDSGKNSKQKRVFCKLCNRSFGYKYYFGFHLREHTGNKPYMCDVCGKNFAQRSRLRLHYRNHTGDRPCICNVCGKSFKQSSDLCSHKRKQHSGTEPLECDQCGKFFKTKETLKGHLETHSGEKTHVCEICGRSIKNTNYFYYHMRSHNEKDVSCLHCGKNFKSKIFMKRHIDRMHLKVKNHVCDECGKRFNTAQLLKVHKFIHTGEKPYSCKICAKTFRQESSVYRHMLVHTGKAQYSCDLCPATFKYSQHHMKHVKSHKKE